MNYQQFNKEDFISDSFFRQWVKHPDNESNLFWENFLKTNPGQADTIYQAAEIVRNISAAAANLSEKSSFVEEEDIWESIKKQAFETESETEETTAPNIWWRGWSTFAAAASVMLMLGILGWVYLNRRTSEPTQVMKELVAKTPSRYIQEFNDAEKPKLVILPDGSSVLLQKDSRLTYARKFDGEKREVYLVGEAYFEVSKNPQQPFFVYANELVTKVLGTSFNIKAYSEENDVVVTVRTGKVAVFHQADPQKEEKKNSLSLDGLVLLPHQQAVFARQELRLSKTSGETVINLPKILPVQISTFIYDAVPASEVFKELSTAYGIEIVYDEGVLKSCRLTADLSDEPLSKKIEIVCKSIEANYDIQSNRIVVSSLGCQ